MAWRKPKHLQEWAHILLRHRKKFFFTALPVMLIVVAASFRIPREFRAEAAFERSSPSVTQETGNAVIRNHVNTIRRTMRENILGRAAIEQLIDDLNMTQGYPRHSDGTLTALGEQMKADKVREIQSRMTIGFRLRDNTMDLVTISYTSPDRLTGPEIVNKATQNYVRKTRLELDDMLGTAVSFYEGRVDNERAKVQEWEAKKLRFESDNPGLDPDNPTAIRNKIVALEGAIAGMRTAMETAQGEHDSLEAYIEETPEFIEVPVTGTNPELTRKLERRANLQLERDRQRSEIGRTEVHPAILKLDALIADMDEQIASLEKQVPTGVRRDFNEARGQAESRIRTLAGNVNTYKSQIDSKQAELRQYQLMEERFYQKREEYENIRRTLADATKKLNFWEGYLQRTQIALDVELNSSGIRLLQTQFAQPLTRPTNPTLPKILGAALAAGLAAGGLMILLAELLDHSFRSVDQAVEELKLPVLGSVAQITTPTDVLHRRIYSWAIYPALGAGMVVVLIAALGAVYLSLESPQKFQELRDNPTAAIRSIAMAN